MSTAAHTKSFDFALSWMTDVSLNELAFIFETCMEWKSTEEQGEAKLSLQRHRFTLLKDRYGSRRGEKEVRNKEALEFVDAWQP